MAINFTETEIPKNITFNIASGRLSRSVKVDVVIFSTIAIRSENEMAHKQINK